MEIVGLLLVLSSVLLFCLRWQSYSLKYSVFSFFFLEVALKINGEGLLDLLFFL